MAELANIPQAALSVLEPRERLSVSEWATRYFVIAEKGAVAPGPYDLEWTPYWREPLDALGDPDVRHVNIVASAQTGKTQVVNVGVAYWMDRSPANMMYVRPAEPDVIEAFRDRFRPMIEANLRRLIVSGEWCNLGKNPVISLSSALIYGAAATIARHLTSRTTLRVVYDETDTGEADANSLGNVLALLDERQMAGSAARSLTLGASTPKLEAGSNWQAYDSRSDAREFCEPCPRCGTFQPLCMPRIRAVGDEKDPALIRRHNLARYLCVECGHMIEPEWQGWMADRGIHVPRNCQVVEPLPLGDRDIVEHGALAIQPDASRWEPKIEGPRNENPHRGYRVWRANTKFEQCSWSNILARFHETRPDPSQFQVFVNNWLAEPWKTGVEGADDDRIRERIGAYDRGQFPQQARVLLAGVDVQRDCVWYVARAFGPNQESWLVDAGRMELAGDGEHGPVQATLRSLYERLIYRGYAMIGCEGWYVRAMAMAVDSGDQTDEVYEFARLPGVIPVKGQDIADWRVRPATVEGKKTPAPLTLWHVNVKAFKDRLQRLIAAGPGEPGEWHLFDGVGEEYVGHLTSEALLRRGNQKRAVWQPKSAGRANHLLDTEVYCLALAEILEQRGELAVFNCREADPIAGQFREGDDPVSVRPRRKRRKAGPSGGWGDAPPAW